MVKLTRFQLFRLNENLLGLVEHLAVSTRHRLHFWMRLQEAVHRREAELLEVALAAHCISEWEWITVMNEGQTRIPSWTCRQRWARCRAAALQTLPLAVATDLGRRGAFRNSETPKLKTLQSLIFTRWKFTETDRNTSTSIQGQSIGWAPDSDVPSKLRKYHKKKSQK